MQKRLAGEAGLPAEGVDRLRCAGRHRDRGAAASRRASILSARGCSCTSGSLTAQHHQGPEPGNSGSIPTTAPSRRRARRSRSSPCTGPSRALKGVTLLAGNPKREIEPAVGLLTPAAAARRRHRLLGARATGPRPGSSAYAGLHAARGAVGGRGGERLGARPARPTISRNQLDESAAHSRAGGRAGTSSVQARLADQVAAADFLSRYGKPELAGGERIAPERRPARVGGSGAAGRGAGAAQGDPGGARTLLQPAWSSVEGRGPPGRAAGGAAGGPSLLRFAGAAGRPACSSRRWRWIRRNRTDRPAGGDPGAAGPGGCCRRGTRRTMPRRSRPWRRSTGGCAPARRGASPCSAVGGPRSAVPAVLARAGAARRAGIEALRQRIPLAKRVDAPRRRRQTAPALARRGGRRRADLLLPDCSGGPEAAAGEPGGSGHQGRALVREVRQRRRRSSAWRKGELVRVRLRITVPERSRSSWCVDDALPAGLEAVDLSLRTASLAPGPGVDQSRRYLAPEEAEGERGRVARGRQGIAGITAAGTAAGGRRSITRRWPTTGCSTRPRCSGRGPTP